MAKTDANVLVSTEWLAAHLQSPDVRVVDGSWYLPQHARDARAEYNTGHIPGAVFFDIDEISDTESDLPHMLPSPEKFTSRARKLGLGDGNRIVVYDGAGLFSAARVWWMFQAMGHDDVAVLDGGLPKWTRENRPIESLVPAPRERHFTARLNTAMIRTADDIVRNFDTGEEVLVDARSAGRFEGREPEPRLNLRSGHIPGSLNLPYDQLLEEDGTLKRDEALEIAFKEAGVGTTATDHVVTCGSGVTAAVVALALTYLGHRSVALYDGSWAEWGGNESLPIELGPAGDRKGAA